MSLLHQSSIPKIFQYKDTTQKHISDIVDVWDSGWSEKLGTVPPWNVNEESMENLDDRMIIHYIQPHSPYIGATKLIGLPKPLPEIDPLQVDDGTWIGADKWIIEGVKQGRTSVQELKLAYRENLKLCLSYIAKLTSELPHNHIIVTSDHGELLGECGFFMHPPKINTPNLRCIPWLELRNGGE